MTQDNRLELELVFGPFCLKPDQYLLLEGGSPVPLGSRALDILIALAQRPGQLVPKNELIACVWPSTVVDESNLRTQISLLRKALRDGREGARYIEAVPGRGYRFVASIGRAGEHFPQRAERWQRLNLPARLTRLIGRDEALSTVLGRFQSCRMTTIVGPGGIGKTTLCLAVAEELANFYRDGVCFFDLAPLSDPNLVHSVFASALNISDLAESSLENIVAFLRDKQILLVLDNCERMIQGTACLVESLLKGTSAVHVLATSREALRIEGESVYQLPPLDAPPAVARLTAAEAMKFSAVELFVERATSGGCGFELRDDDAPVVADICRQLDGIALAIELAAGRVNAYGARGVAERLDDRFRLLRGGRRTALPRHQTLIATLDWSYDSLSDPERAVLRRLSIFAEEFTFELACEIVTDEEIVESDVADYLADLIAKSLISANPVGPTSRYRLLESTRAYARSKLSESGEFEPIMRRMAEYLRVSLENAFNSLEAVSGSEWLNVFGHHINNVQMVLDWAFSSSGDNVLGTSLTIAAIPLWFELSLIDECRERVNRALESIESEESRDLHARQMILLCRALGLSRAFTHGLAPQAVAAWIKALEISERFSDAEDQLEALWGLWFCQIGTADYRAALVTGQRFSELAKSESDLLIADRLIGTPLYFMGEHVDARPRVERMLARDSMAAAAKRADSVRFRFDQVVAARVLLAKILWLQGFPDQAMKIAQDAVEGPPATTHAIALCDALSRGLCPIALDIGDLARAEDSISMLLDYADRHALGPWEILGRCWKAALSIKKGDFEPGLSLLDVSLVELRRGRFFAQYYNGLRGVFAEGLAAAGRVSEGRIVIDETISRCEKSEDLWCMAELLRIKGEIMRLDETVDKDISEKLFFMSIEWARKQHALSWELRSTISMGRLLRDQGRQQKAKGVLLDVYSKFTEGFTTTDLKTAKALMD